MALAISNTARGFDEEPASHGLPTLPPPGKPGPCGEGEQDGGPIMMGPEPMIWTLKGLVTGARPPYPLPEGPAPRLRARPLFFGL
jgi:hypothetical protein